MGLNTIQHAPSRSTRFPHAEHIQRRSGFVSRRKRGILTVGGRLHAESQQRVQEIDDVVEAVGAHVLAECPPELRLVQVVELAEAVVRLRRAHSIGWESLVLEESRVCRLLSL